MTGSLLSTDPRDLRSGYVVRKPRPGDALGGSLRNIYDADPRMPPEFASLLRRI